jgi:hypothetical protein
MLAMFEFNAEPKPTPTAVFDDAAKAKTAGYLVDIEDLQERTGYKLVSDPQNSVSGQIQPTTPTVPVANKAVAVANPLQIAPVAPEALPPGEETQKAAPPENAKKTASPAKRTDPVEAALKALEAGATPEAALDAFDQAAKEALAPEAVAAQAEQIATELDAAAAAGKEGK